MTVRAGLPLFTVPTRARLVDKHALERQPSQRLRDRSPAYGLAIEMYTIAIDLGCDDRIASALWEVCQRAADCAAAEEERRRG